jgi:hypothetical protein
MIRLALCLGLGTLSGCGMISAMLPVRHATPVPAPASVPVVMAPKERLVAAIAANGCVLTRDNVSAILSQSQVPQADVRALTNELAAEGRAEVSAAGTIRVLTDTCI